MKQPGQPENYQEQQWRSRLRLLRQHPAPDLARGRARVLAAAQRRLTRNKPPRQVPLALAFGSGLGVILVMIFMSSTMGALQITRVAMTRTETNAIVESATNIPFGAHALSPEASEAFNRAGTPVPGAVPEPPRSPVVASTSVIEP